MRLVDTSERAIAGKETILVRCRKCDCIGSVTMANLRVRIANSGETWQCHACLKKEMSTNTSRQMSQNNPFKGKTHSQEFKESQKQKGKQRWKALSEKEQNEAVQRMHDGILNKHGVTNAMSIPGVKEAHKAGMKKTFKDKDLLNKIIQKRRNTNAEKYGTPFPEHRPESRKNAVLKTVETNRAKYGVDHFFQSAIYQEQMADNNWYVSKGETEVREFIESLGFATSKIRIGKYEIDCLVESKNIGFEYNGLYWHSEANPRVDRNYHLNKTKAAEAKGIQLIHIFEHEWAERKEQVKSRITSLLGKNQKRIHARKCAIVQVSYKEAFAFFDQYHIQSGTKAELFIGLQFEGQLVALASFGTHHRGSSQKVMSRFCTKANYTIAGGLSKICKHARSILGCPIISWCDLRWSNGSGYLASGWIVDATLKPDYFYVKNKKAISKQSRMKKKVKTPEGMTEREHAIQDGLHRVWDCGKIRFIFP